MAYGGLVGQSSAEAENVGYNNKNTSTIIKSDNVQGAIDQLFTSVSEGKSLVAKAVTDKGVQTALDATFEKIAENVGKIEKVSNIARKALGTLFYRNIIGLNNFKVIDGTPNITYNGDTYTLDLNQEEASGDTRYWRLYWGTYRSPVRIDFSIKADTLWTEFIATEYNSPFTSVSFRTISSDLSPTGKTRIRMNYSSSNMTPSTGFLEFEFGYDEQYAACYEYSTNTDTFYLFR